MSPEISFTDVDIVINRNSLRKFLQFCSGSALESFRVNLTMVHNTLLVERCEKKLCRGNTGWGHGFEKVFTKAPKGGGRKGHHRALRYALGELNCVVLFEVDACYVEGQTQEKDANEDVQGVLALDIGKLSIESTSPCNKIASIQTSSVEKRFNMMPQSTAAEIKTCSSYRPSGRFLPQLWFGRTPWLMEGHHVNGKFDNINITNAGLRFAEWENRRQTDLKKVVSLLSQLREVVKRSSSKHCMAICEKHTRPRELMVFESTHQKGGLPNDLISKFWGNANDGAQ